MSETLNTPPPTAIFAVAGMLAIGGCTSPKNLEFELRDGAPHWEETEPTKAQSPDENSLNLTD